MAVLGNPFLISGHLGTGQLFLFHLAQKVVSFLSSMFFTGFTCLPPTYCSLLPPTEHVRQSKSGSSEYFR